MGDDAALADLLPNLRVELTAVADPARAPAMAAYMKHQFRFLGVASSARRTVSRPFIAAGRGASADELLDAADACWAQSEREFQYVGTDLLVRWVDSLRADSLDRITSLIRTRSWWDTVDALAANVVGPLVAGHPELAASMDRWIDDDLWVARAAILHQLTYRERTDAERLFHFIDVRCGDTDFFMRKACGWALRQYGRTDPDAVADYVADRGERLSGLTRREALKHIERV